MIRIDKRKYFIPEASKEDLKDHYNVSAVIYNSDNKILMLDHIKYDMWTIPVGKVKSNQSFKDALIEEVKEETDLEIEDFKLLSHVEIEYCINNIQVLTSQHIFLVGKYIGEPKNLEVNKHRSLKFMSIDEIKNIGIISDVTKEMLKVLAP